MLQQFIMKYTSEGRNEDAGNFLKNISKEYFTAQKTAPLTEPALMRSGTAFPLSNESISK